MDSHLLPGDMELQRDRQVRLYPPGRDTELNLPPHIPRSVDGEEGYAESSQRLLQANTRRMKEANESMRAPPNKTVFQGESPPPYRVQPNGTRHPPRKIDSSRGTPVAYPNISDVNPQASIPYTPLAMGAAARHTRAGRGNHPHDNPGPMDRAHTTGHSRSGDNPTACCHSDNSCQSNQHNNGASYGPPPDYSEVVPQAGSLEQRGLPNSSSNNNSKV